jgi:thymidylate synthase (FAD)
VEFTSEIKVELIQHTGSDESIAAAARVSTGLDLLEYTPEQNRGLIKYLMKNRHGSPFEHNSMTFRAMVPIFCVREWQRHRIGWSYNEVSGRYKKLEPTFYVASPYRPLVQSGNGAHPKLVDGGPVLTKVSNGIKIEAYTHAWGAYEKLLDLGLANEVARDVLPVGIYTEMYATCNARSLMSFLSLRVDHPDNTFSTKPQWEIQKAAERMELHFKALFPETWGAYIGNGRVAP